MAFRLENPVRDYDWGSLEEIPRLLGQEPTGRPAAELWLGAHPLAPSRTPEGGLDEVIGGAPAELLGEGRHELPFLMKVLSAARPLSIQAHPSRDQAQEGFAAEEAAGVSRDDPARNFKDANHKPEIIYALTPFAALSGFRPVVESHAVLAALQQAQPTAFGARLVETAEDSSLADDAARLAALSELILGSPQEAGQTADAWAQAAQAGRAEVPPYPGGGTPLDTLREVSTAYPGDAGILMALLLNRVDLRPGQVLATGARTLHAYLHGTGIEVMAASDNVLRGGLTSKHVDVPTLLRIGQFAPEEPLVQGAGPDSHEAVDPSQDAGAMSFRGTSPEVALTVLGRAGEGTTLPDGPLLVLCLDGVYRFGAPLTGPAELSAGQSAFLGAGEPREVSGDGRLFVSHLA
ncbi:mannose-6-phosphate isomerase, class I [Sediminivirga luteola]|uniref:mannose-6-phosphate isomerase n=1 Tax=Sediminivirga luteola TaxID=1774748 RepID=A0A8J2TZ10_9MICO|nr:mannose-6-phosphate isomerase, class I [Sediminivirga luteola]GGA18609.1 mannose-6-phosphate isomerase, class I [Sediminivirga luteola]